MSAMISGDPNTCTTNKSMHHGWHVACNEHCWQFHREPWHVESCLNHTQIDMIRIHDYWWFFLVTMFQFTFWLSQCLEWHYSYEHNMQSCMPSFPMTPSGCLCSMTPTLAWDNALWAGALAFIMKLSWNLHGNYISMVCFQQKSYKTQ